MYVTTVTNKDIFSVNELCVAKVKMSVLPFK